MTERSPTEKEILITELQQLGIKHSPERILKIAKTPNGKIVFLEIGNIDSGFQHILINHQSQFADINIIEAQIPDAVIEALLRGEIVSYQTVNRPIYRLTFNGQTQYIAVTVGSNGYIVCANPRSRREFGE